MKIEQGGVGLTVNTKLVSYNGPDGVGKDAILEKVIRKLGQNAVTVIDPDPIKEQFPGQKEIKAKIQAKPSEYRYSFGYWLALPNTEQALNSGEIVIVKRPFNFLMHAIRLQQSKGVGYLESKIASGRATNGLWPAVWIEITASKEDIIENLRRRATEGKNTSSDPEPENEQVEKYLKAQMQVLEFVRSVSAKGNVKYVEISNPRIENLEEREKSLQQLADLVIKSLPSQT